MSKLPILSGRNIIRILQKLGFKVVRIKGSHWILEHGDGRTGVVPVHGIEIFPASF